MSYLQLELGHTTTDALLALYEECISELQQIEKNQKQTRFRSILQCFHHKNAKSVFHWTSFVLLALLSIGLFLAYGFTVTVTDGLSKHFYQNWWLFEACVVAVTLFFNTYLTSRNQNLRIKEPVRLVKEALQKIRECVVHNTWNAATYLHLNSPMSPCFSTQWTLRDGQIVNLPTVLVVKGDVILLRPGYTVPAKCTQLEKSDENQELVLCAGDIYAPQMEEPLSHYSLPQGRTPLKAKKFLVLETPFVKNIRTMLENDVQRLTSIMDSERFQVCSVWLERRLIPSMFIIMLVVNIIRYRYLDVISGSWVEMILVLQVHSILPLAPLIFPIFWRLINSYCQARVFVAYEVSKQIKPSVSEGSFDSDGLISADEARVELSLKRVMEWVMMLLMGKSPTTVYNVNIMHTLGSITTLCCVDKKGILSWPNPSAEKVFFLSGIPQKNNSQGENLSDSVCSVVEDNPGIHGQTDTESMVQNKQPPKEQSRLSLPAACVSSSYVEVLDLTHDIKNAFGIHFDDPSWMRYMNSLKPLGLNILANTCNPDIASWYNSFTDHIACAALENKESVAVINRRCLCELAKQIGFSDHAMDIFSKDKVFGVYRQVSAELAAKEKLHRACSSMYNRIPMPNMVSVTVEEKTSGAYQLLCQGTADLILDCCSDFWDGQDLCMLTEPDRKRILDFYNRTSMVSFCTAFSYRPLTRNMVPQIKDLFIKLPSDSAALSHYQSSHGFSTQFVNLKSDIKNLSMSSDSMVVEEREAFADDISACVRMQCNQIFIGMVAMQYQARQEFVQLIEKLEMGCIRFVYFSKENELRSRVFSEKMGLEAGWNCHISLLPVTKPDENLLGGTLQGDLSLRASKHSSRYSADTVDKDAYFLATQKRRSHDSSAYVRSHSAPSLMNTDLSQFKVDESLLGVCPQCYFDRCKDDTLTIHGLHHSHVGSDSSPKILTMSYNFETPLPKLDTEEDPLIGFNQEHMSESCITENTEDSLPAVLNNRAKLPRGIDNIRPHLENVDNVPLLVNLFTDCTPHATKEMIKIMQEYGEVVLCVGSSVNINNTAVYLQADCSFAIEPLYPQVCSKIPVLAEPCNDKDMSPTQLASLLMSIPCPLVFQKGDNISLVQLIAEARNQALSMQNCFQLMLCFHLSLSIVQILASMLLLPPPLSTRHILWLIFVIIPLLCFSMMGNRVEPHIMTLATGKNCNHISKEMLLHFLVSFLLKFVPPIVVSLTCFTLTLHFVCDSKECRLYNFGAKVDHLEWQGWYNFGGFAIAQNIMLLQLVLYYVAISGSFVHRSNHIWKHPPYTNHLWVVVIVIVIISHIVFFVCDIGMHKGFEDNIFIRVHSAIWVVTLLWPLVTLAINELVKRYEIKLSVRYQKRAQLEFETKLGMNSPF